MELTFEHPLFNDNPNPVFSLDLNGNFTSVNKALVNLAECTKEELLNTSFGRFLPPENLEKISAIFHDATEGEIQNFEANVVSAKGTNRTLCITNIPIVTGGKVSGVYAIAQDITEQKKNEEKLRAYHHQVSTILESITDAFFALDKNWIVTYWNQEAVRMINVPRENIVGKNLWEVFEEAIPLKFYDEYHIAMEQKVSRRFEEYFGPLGLWLEVSAFPSEDGLSVYFKDITQRKEVENQVKIQKERYQNLFNLSPLPHWVFDHETLQFLDVNVAAIVHYGYSKKEFLNMTIREICSSEDINSLEEIINTDLKPNRFHRSLVRHHKKNGEQIMVKIEANPLLYEGKDAWLVLAVDDTEKIKALQSLEASEQRFKSLVQDGSDLIGILDTRGTYQYVSPNTEAVLGIKSEDFIGKSAFDFVHENDREAVLEQFSLIGSRKRLEVSPFRFKNINDQYRWVETIATDMTDEPAVAGIVTNSRDVTERMENELSLKENIERYNMVSKATLDTIYDWDIPRNNILWNSGLKKVFGYKENNTTLEWWSERVHPDDTLKMKDDLLLSIRKKKSRWQGKYRFRCADGTYKFVFERGFLKYNDAKEAVRMTGVLQDVTELENHIQVIEKQNERLREISWTQSHVVRAPLSRIMALSELIRDNNNDDELMAELLQHLNFSVNELDGVIKEIVRKTAGIEAGPDSN